MYFLNAPKSHTLSAIPFSYAEVILLNRCGFPPRRATGILCVALDFSLTSPPPSKRPRAENKTGDCLKWNIKKHLHTSKRVDRRGRKAVVDFVACFSLQDQGAGKTEMLLWLHDEKHWKEGNPKWIPKANKNCTFFLWKTRKIPILIISVWVGGNSRSCNTWRFGGWILECTWFGLRRDLSRV